MLNLNGMTTQSRSDLSQFSLLAVKIASRQSRLARGPHLR